MFPVCRWMFLLGLAVVMLLSVSEAETYAPTYRLPCCHMSGVYVRKGFGITKCYEQKPRDGCNHHAFLVINKKNEQACISPTAVWLQQRIAKKQLVCPQDISAV